MTIQYWIGGDGNWATASNWAPAAVPTAGDFDLLVGQHPVATNIVIDNQSAILINGSSTNGALTLTGSTLGTSSEIVSQSTGTNAITFDNTALRGVFAQGYGASTITLYDSTVNYGYIGASHPSHFANLEVDTYGSSFANYGYIDAGVNGLIRIGIGTFLGQGSNVIWNSGTIQADAGGGQVVLTASNGGALGNSGALIANGGTVTVAANLVNLGSASQVDVLNNGTLALNGVTSGSTINIQSGMLELGPGAIQFLSSPIALTGSNATFQFDQATIVDQFNAAAQAMLITATYASGQTSTGILQFAPSSILSAANFSINHTSAGDQILYTAHTG